MKAKELFNESTLSRVSMFIEKEILEMGFPVFIYEGRKLMANEICESDNGILFSFRGKDINLADVIKLINDILSQAKKVEKEVASFNKSLLNIGNVGLDTYTVIKEVRKEAVVEILEWED